MKMVFMASALALIAASTSAAANTAEQSDGRIEAGYLTCEMEDGSNLILISEKTFSCIFSPSADGTREAYELTVAQYGLDLSITETQELRWAVLAPSTFDMHGVLEGTYGGVSADVAVGYGIGAKALVGGGDNSIALQPVSVTKGEGLGAALGVERATLTYTGLAGT